MKFEFFKKNFNGAFLKGVHEVGEIEPDRFF